MKHCPWLFVVCVSLQTAACSKPQPDRDDAHDETVKTAAPGNNLQLTAEAIKRAAITVAKVERRALSAGAAIAAEVQFDPTSTAHVGPLAPGRITRVAVELGQRVKRGELLGVVNSGDVSSVRSRLVQAKARQAAASATLRRQEQLTHEGIGAQRSLIDAQTSVSELQAEVEGLTRQLAALGSGEAGELSLLSPIDGVVVSVRGTLGESANVDQPVFVVTDPERVWMRGDVPELEIPRLALNEKAIVRLHAFPDLALAGTITYIAPALEERTRTLPIRVSLSEPDTRLRGGMFGSLELLGSGEDARALAIPVDALTTLDGHDVVFVADLDKGPGAFHPVAVQLGRRAAGYYEVRSGLSEGDAIAVTGSFTLKSALRESDLSDGDSD